MINVHPLSDCAPFDVRTMRFFSLTCPSLTSILFVFTCCYLRRVSHTDLWHCSLLLLFSLSLALPRTFPFSQRQNKLIRSEVRAYQWGISIQIKDLSGHKQQEAKQDPGAAEWEDEKRGESETERNREHESEGTRDPVAVGRPEIRKPSYLGPG